MPQDEDDLLSLCFYNSNSRDLFFTMLTIVNKFLYPLEYLSIFCDAR